ncbi:MAG: MlaD family protein [candidate division FCPU426 bacterium]
MPQGSREKRVGWTVAAGLACLGVLVVFLGRIHFSSPGYPLIVDFRYVDSLKLDAPVLYGGGVKVGTVSDVGVSEGLVRVTLHIFKKYKIPLDSHFTIHTSGILGEKYVQIDAGDLSKGVLSEGAVVAGLDPASLDRTLRRVEALADYMTPLMEDGKFKASFGETMQNLNTLSAELASLVHDSGADIRVTVGNLKELSADLRTRGGELKDLVSNARGMVNDKNRKNLESSLQSLESTLSKLDKALTAIEQKKGPLGALIYDEQSAQDMREILRDLKQHPWKLLWKK